MFKNLPNFKDLMSVDKARDMFEATNKAANEYFTSVYELNVKLALWSKKNDDVSKD
jgi:hypothetical protein